MRDENGDTVIGVNTSLSQLKAQRTESKFTKVEGKYKNHCLLEVELPWMIRYRLAIMFFCTVGGTCHFLLLFLLLMISCESFPGMMELTVIQRIIASNSRQVELCTYCSMELLFFSFLI